MGQKISALLHARSPRPNPAMFLSRCGVSAFAVRTFIIMITGIAVRSFPNALSSWAMNSLVRSLKLASAWKVSSHSTEWRLIRPELVAVANSVKRDAAIFVLMSFSSAHFIFLVIFSTLASGLLTQRGVPDWHPATQEDMAITQQAVAFCEANGTSLEKVAMQYSTCNPDIPTTLVSTASVENITKNIKWVEEPIDEAIVKEIQKIISPLMNKVWSMVHDPDEPS